VRRLQFESLRALGPVSQHEATNAAEADRCDHRVASEFGFIVGMPAHAVIAVAIEIQ